jgi:mycofactocin precursor
MPGGASPGGASTAQTLEAPPQQVTDETLTSAEMLIEEVSIDGMCGVY